MSRVHSQLMGAPGYGIKIYTRLIAFYTNHLPFGFRGLAILIAYELMRTVIEIYPQRQINKAFLLLQHTVQQGNVAFLYCFFDKLALNIVMRLFGLCCNQQTRCSHIQAMHQQRSCGIWIPLLQNAQYTILYIDAGYG
ncbi:hypothetical protein D3C86_1237840 [compost metagenome]